MAAGHLCDKFFMAVRYVNCVRLNKTVVKNWIKHTFTFIKARLNGLNLCFDMHLTLY